MPDAHLAELAAQLLFEVLGSELSIKRLLVEGSGNVNGSLLAAGVVDEVSLLVAPAIDGALGGTGVFEVLEAAGNRGRCGYGSSGSEALGHGLVHLQYGAAPG